MNKYLNMIVFVIILGMVTSFALMTANTLTEDLIAANQEINLQATVLDHHDIEFTLADINDVFESEINVVHVDDRVFYLDYTTGLISFVFYGGGVWGPIEGVVTLEDDFQTILKITILEEEETPGLGGIVAERQYLDNYVGAVLPVRVSHDSDIDNDSDVDAITGGTRTSESFEQILNSSYAVHKDAWESYVD